MENKPNAKHFLRNMKEDLELLKKIPCSEEENAYYMSIVNSGATLPEGVFRYRYADGKLLDSFYTVEEVDLSDSEIIQYLLLVQNHRINTIRKCVIFFTVLTIINMIFSLLTILPML